MNFNCRVTMGLLLLVAALSTNPVSTRAAPPVGPEPIALWPNGAPGKVGDEPVDKPELRIYLPKKEGASGAGIVICPGGGYGALAMDHEGHQIARWLNSIGVAGFVLKYRLGPRYHHPAPMSDVQRAIRHVRANAEQFGIAANRIGVMGFSAGGHLASTAATHFEAGNAKSDDAVERVSCRPDFAILCYPVISFTAEFTHRGSVRNLLGENPDPKLVESLSNETQVTKDTPPVFLFHTGDDTGVPAENSLAFYQACRKVGVPAELHIYRFGPHGVGLAPGDPALSTWKVRLADWLKVSGFLASTDRAAVEGTIRVNGEPLRWGTVIFVPTDGSHKPTAFAMVSNGNFKISASNGPAVGACRLEVHGLGAIEPRPTVNDIHRIDGNKHNFTVQPGSNKITVEIEAN